MTSDAYSDGLKIRVSVVQFHPRPPFNSLSIPVGWVTVYTGDMGNSFAANGFSALSIRHVSWSKKPKS